MAIDLDKMSNKDKLARINRGDAVWHYNLLGKSAEHRIRDTELNTSNTLKLVQKVPAATAAEVWDRRVSRGGEKISAIQELADCKTMLIALTGEFAALTQLVSQIKTDQVIDYERIDRDRRKALAEGLKLTITTGEESE